MKLAPAKADDLQQVMELINDAKTYLKSQRVDQWQNGYPDEECIKNDILRGTGYLCIADNKIVGYVCVDFDGEPAYEELCGEWISIQPYVVVHRLALSGYGRGKGLSSQVFSLVEEMAKQRDIHSFKVDTDNDNEIMKHLLTKMGFQYCGTICFDNSEKIAYEKLI